MYISLMEESRYLPPLSSCPFEYLSIIKAHKIAKEKSYYGTDDSMLMEYLGYNVKVIEGSYNNIKITTPEDLKIGEEILNENKKEIN